ncbi:MAG: PAS domain S-box protein [Burkholderiaceae bacterium]|nr:PAS domain S-box protein [Burkholderiaceae bacterium]
MSTVMDRSTLLVVAILLTLAAVLILVVVRQTRKTYPGFGLWAGSMALAMAGTVSFLTIQQVNPRLALLIGSLLLVVAFVFLYRGLLEFRGRTANYAFELLLALVLFAGFVFFGFVRPNLNGYVAVYSLCLGSAAAMGARVVLTGRPSYFGSPDRILASWLGLITAFTWSRAAYSALFLAPIDSLNTDTTFQTAYIAFQIISVLVITFAVINLNSQRLEHELRTTQASLERDIEERRRVEGALLRSQQQYRSLTENMDDNAWIYDMDDQRFVYVSPSVRKLKGYTPDEVMRLAIDSMVLPHQREQMQAVLDERHWDFLSDKITSQDFFLDELEQPCKGGKTVWTEISSHFVRSAETGHVEVHGVTRDLTGRREITEALRASEEKFRLAFASANTGIFLSDLEGRIQQTNSRAEQILGYNADELRGMLEQNLALAGDAWLTESNRKRMTDGLVDHSTYEQRFTHRDGPIVHCLVSSALVRGADDKPNAFITQLQDITQRRLAEKALHAALKKSATHAARMGALNETVKGLMRCENREQALHLIESRLEKMFFPFDCQFVQADLQGHLPESSADAQDFSVDLQGKVIGILRIYAENALLREEDLAQFAETVSDSISLALANLQLREETRLRVGTDGGH